MKYMQVLDELELKDKKCKTLQNNLEAFNKKFNISKHQLGLIYDTYFDFGSIRRRGSEICIFQVSTQFGKIVEKQPYPTWACKPMGFGWEMT